MPGCRVRVRFAGPAGRRLRAGARRDDRAPGQAGPAGAGGLARAGADAGDRRPGPGGRRPVRRHAGRRAPARRPAAARRRRTGGPGRSAPHAPPAPAAPDPGSWTPLSRPGRRSWRGLAEGRPARAVWSALPAEPDWPRRARRRRRHRRSPRAAARCVVVPDARDVDRVDAALTASSARHHVCLTADLGPAERYRRWLAVRRGQVRVVVGTRAAMFAPVADLGLVAVWDDGDDLHAEPRAPYPHAREVLALRAHRTGAAALVGGFARTAELHPAGRGRLGPAAGRQRPRRCGGGAPGQGRAGRGRTGQGCRRETARLPSLALRTAREALTGGARGGLTRARSWSRCRGGATWPRSPAPGAAPRPGAPPAPGRWRSAARTGRPAAGGAARWRRTGLCPLRFGPAARAGHRRGAHRGGTGPRLPRRAVRTSGGQHVLAAVPAEPALVVATPGAEPVAPGGYAAALLLDGWALLGRPRPARRRGGPAPLAERGRPGPPGRRPWWCWPRRRCPRCRR